MELHEIIKGVSEHYGLKYETDGKKVYVKRGNGAKKEIKKEVLEKVFGLKSE